MEPNIPKNKQWPQYVVAVSACLGMICGGTLYGWTSPSQTILLADDSPIKMTYGEFAWVLATTTGTSALSPIACAYLLDRIGRKPLLLISAVFYILSWLCIVIWETLPSLFVSKFLGGIGVGISMSCIAVYIGETAETGIRGSMGVLKTLAFNFGVVFESIVGPSVSFRTLNVVSLIFPVLFLLTFIWMPESPYYLMLKEMPEKASSSLMWLRGQKDMQPLLEEMEDIKEYTKINKLTFCETMKALLAKNCRRALALTLVIGFGKQFSGLIAISSYTERIFIQINSPIDPPNAVILLNVISAVFIFSSVFVVDRIGRKKPLLLSITGTSICHFVIATYLLLSQIGTIDKDAAWIAMVGLFGFNMFLSFGLSSIPYILMSEIFPSETKRGVSVSTHCTNRLFR